LSLTDKCGIVLARGLEYVVEMTSVIFLLPHLFVSRRVSLDLQECIVER